MYRPNSLREAFYHRIENGTRYAKKGLRENSRKLCKKLNLERRVLTVIDEKTDIDKVTDVVNKLEEFVDGVKKYINNL